MIKEYLATYKNKKVGFVGVGVSNMPIIRLFCKEGIFVSLRDIKDVSAGEFGNELLELGVTVITGEGYLDNIDEDVLFLSPGVKQFMPQLKDAAKKGTVLTTEMQEFFKLCPCNTIGVTGSDGKTTTTTLIAKLLEAQGKKVHLGGNIGKNLFSVLDDIAPDDYVVAELSSFQLMKMTVSPQVAVITNLSPNHLDWHKDMDEYVDAKKNIFRYQNDDGVVITNATNAVTAKIAVELSNKCITFGHEKADFYITDDGIYTKDGLYLKNDDILLPGIHNRENYAAAIAATYGIVDRETVVALARTFGGVEHRIELVREVNGVRYYNSSIDSSPSRTKAALESFKEKVIVIAGGYDKNIPLEPLGELFNRKVKAAVLMGNTGGKIKSVLKNSGFAGDVAMAENMSDAVKKASMLANSGDVVILSPAAASFDLFKNFAERGQIFKDIVNSL